MIEYALAFVSGVLVKAVDWLDDERKSRHPVKFALALAYGICIGYLIGTAPFAILFLSALIAQVFARKIDTAAHWLGFSAAIVSLLYFGFSSIDLPLFFFFLLLAFLDEVDYVGRLRPITDYRLFLKIGALSMLYFGRIDYFAGIMAFDIGYALFQIGARMAKNPMPDPEH